MFQEELHKLGGNWLLVVDDVWSGRLIDESPIPNNMGCKLLITSRFPLKGLPAIRIKVDEQSNEVLGAKLLASKAAYRNPNLAKCGGEAQHLEKLGIWSLPGLPNV